MTTLQLIDNTIPKLQLGDTLFKALQLMNQFKLTHLPVVGLENFLGLISEEALLSEKNKKSTIAVFQNDLVPAAINVAQHFLKGVSICNLYQTNIIPVVNESGELLGSIGEFALLKALGDFCGASEYGALVVLEMERTRFAISEINSIVESDDATILHLNIITNPSSGLLEVTLQINKKEISTIIATFERYDYSISYYSGEELFENDISSNYQNLMNYLDI
ncbi:MAG: CBS domain-containing protein [Bacteroidota bacterium]|jgi:acetoin utilization protein AcuB|nr:CBS domain-containing protein [Bacteroidota bacterium]